MAGVRGGVGGEETWRASAEFGRDGQAGSRPPVGAYAPAPPPNGLRLSRVEDTLEACLSSFVCLRYLGDGGDLEYCLLQRAAKFISKIQEAKMGITGKRIGLRQGATLSARCGRVECE